MLAKAQAQQAVEFNLVDLRRFGLSSQQQVDDTPYGGGSGMILMVEPLVAALEFTQNQHQSPAHTILLTPAGELLHQSRAQSLAQTQTDLILLGGRYEGYDERITHFVDVQISIGDYIVTGFELPALVLIDAIVRLRPGVLGNPQSLCSESFQSSPRAIEYPQYTKPADFRGLKVPDILLSGHHQQIAAWRQEQTRQRENKSL